MSTAGGQRIGALAARLLGATAITCLMAYCPLTSHVAAAEEFDDIAGNIPSDAQLVLVADTLVYDQDNDTISAIGGVRIEYAGNRLVAQRVIYYRRTGRLVAEGNVEIIDRDGNRITARVFDVTDDFKEGFVNALQVETTDETYFGAESAERSRDMVTTFNNGVYTACKPCEDNPDKPPIWQIKAKKIIWNGKSKTIRFEDASFEFLGLPLAGLPYFEIADHTVKRKTGFLIPSARYASELGYGVTVPYYIALDPTYDLTLMGTGLSRQGFLGEAEWRQQFDNGHYNLKIAGIHQANTTAFPAGTVDAMVTNRGMIGSTGEFKINPRWTFGWDVLIQSDKNFSRTYGIEGFEDYVQRSQIYLTGLNDRNYFDLRFMRFNVQESVPDTAPTAADNKQPWVLPSFDYVRTHDEPVAGGEMSVEVNARVIHRDTDDFVAGVPAVPGLGGTNSRITAEAEWKRTFITSSGVVLTPSLHVRGDAIQSDPTAVGVANIGTVAAALATGTNIQNSYYRFMPTAGIEIRYPILISDGYASHIIEPIVQVYARPDERYAGTLGIPNEDAQSLVFDASTLLERDKYSGRDRVEGGTRANAGIRYSASFANGWGANALVGQSYHLAGTNSFATPDLVHTGVASGLETNVSDFVAMAGVVAPAGLAASIGGRFDENTLTVRRAELKAAYSSEPVMANVRFAYIQAQPLYGFPMDRRELSLGSSYRLQDNWRVFGAGTYDFVSDQLVSGLLGFGYEDECFTYTLAYQEERSILGTMPTERNVLFRVSLRTLGDTGSDLDEFNP